MSPRDLDRFWRRIARRGSDECWPWLGARNGRGYGQFRDERDKRLSAHRVVLAQGGVCVDPRVVVRHSCDTPLCCNPRHLLVGTQADNIGDMVARGRQARGARNGQSKVTVEQVGAIRAEVAGGALQRVVAARYGVSRAQVSRIANGVDWQWLDNA